MKLLDELGISPTPWKIENTPNILHPDVISSVKTDIVCIGCRNCANARLIAAAPKLYDALREAVKSYCEGCNDFVIGDQRCDSCECLARKWRAVLAEAAGESEVAK